jgi:hypothetical protein
MQHPELGLLICTALAVELAHLRWILVSRPCKCCGEPHLRCARKPAWVRVLL